MKQRAGATTNFLSAVQDVALLVKNSVSIWSLMFGVGT